MRKTTGVVLTPGSLRGLSYMQTYRFLTIAQFADVSSFSRYHAGEVLRRYEGKGLLGHIGGIATSGHGRTPKVYFLTRKGWDVLRSETDRGEDTLGPYVEVGRDIAWSPQMDHRLHLLDLFVALEMQVGKLDHLHLSKIFLEYRRVPGTPNRETADYVIDQEVSENRIVPDGAFILENIDTGMQGLFFLEMDMGTERIVAKGSRDTSATIYRKFEQYDRYLTSGRFARTYAPFGEFRLATILLVTFGPTRVENIRKAAEHLRSTLHPYYRLATFAAACRNFLGFVWKSRDLADSKTYALVKQP
jgi:Replication-relaxation